MAKKYQQYPGTNNINLEGKIMNKDIKKTNQNYMDIPLDDCVQTNYQRPTNATQVNKIVNGFDEAKLGTLTVSFRDDRYHIVDGLHRSVALKKFGYTHALCIVLTGLTYEQEAEFFRRQNENKRAIMTFDDFTAGLEAKDPTYLDIEKTLKSNNYSIGKGGYNKIAAIQALFTIVKDFGLEALDNTLFLIAVTWGEIKESSQSEVLLGVAEFVDRYGTVDFIERLRGKFYVIQNDYFGRINVRGSIYTTTARKKFCRILVEHYNRGIRSNNRKFLRFEESRI